MGALSAMDMAEQADMRTAISWHLTANHYPPVSVSMIDVCIEAIDAYNEGAYNEPIELPEGILYKGQTTAPAWAIVDQRHLEFWIEEDV